jgi:hypothetical protein
MEPAGAVGLAGVVGGAGVGLVVVGGGGAGVGLDLGVGTEGSVGPVPGPAIGFPSMTVLHPETNTGPASRAVSTNDPPAKRLRAVCDKRTRVSPNI